MSDGFQVVVGVDAAGRSRDAVGLARRMTSLPGVCLHLAHVVEPTTRFWPLTPALEDAELHRIGFGVMKEFAPDLREDAHVHILQGHAVRALAGLCLDVQADVLILGRLDEGCRDPLIGGTARAIVRSSTCPVLLNKTLTDVLPRVLLVAVDLSDSSRAVVQQAIRWAHLLQAFVHVLHVFELPRFSWPDGERRFRGFNLEAVREAEALRFEQFMSETDWQGLEPNRIELEGQPSIRILQAALSSRADLVVVGTQGCTALEGISLGSVAEHVVRRAGHTLLVPTRSCGQGPG